MQLGEGNTLPMDALDPWGNTEKGRCPRSSTALTADGGAGALRRENVNTFTPYLQTSKKQIANSSGKLLEETHSETKQKAKTHTRMPLLFSSTLQWRFLAVQ